MSGFYVAVNNPQLKIKRATSVKASKELFLVTGKLRESTKARAHESKSHTSLVKYGLYSEYIQVDEV